MDVASNPYFVLADAQHHSSEGAIHNLHDLSCLLVEVAALPPGHAGLSGDSLCGHAERV